MSKKLVIVESPTKANTISRFLGQEYNVQSSNGHIRDLPKSKMGIDIEKDFAPQYVIPAKSEKRANELKKLAEKADDVYFSTDEDREGEAISWHLANIFKTPDDKIKRVVFHEITKEAIKEAFKNPRKIDLNMVDAQQARRVLDRLVGYELSPFLWKKVARGLSAGRVQSVALRLIVEREREIEAFKSQEFWTIEGKFEKETKDSSIFPANLTKVNGKKLDKLAIANKKEAQKILSDLENAKYAISKIVKKGTKRTPQPPFTTSSLQQAANRRYSFSPKRTMMIAQQLYEGINLGEEGSQGLITYMRTDSVNLSDKFLNEAKGVIESAYGREYTLPSPRRYKAKSKLAQEAHEAVRPTEVSRKPDDVKEYLDPGQFKLYDLIWRRAVASQTTEAKLESTTVDIDEDKKVYTFQTKGISIVFDGFLKVAGEPVKEVVLPRLAENDPLHAIEIKPSQHFTEPPGRYSEAGLVKALEEYGIGRPSTYAPTIETIVYRNYVTREERKLKPSEIGTLVNDVLIKHFPKIVDYKFTAEMENELDEIARGKNKWVPIIKEFYIPFKKHLMQKEEEVSKKELTEQATDQTCEKCGQPMVIKMGRFGKFMACSGYPDCKNTKQLDANGAVEKPKTTDEKCEKCGAPMVFKRGRFGEFLGCSKYPDCKTIKGIQKKTGVKCPQCNQGDIVEKRSRKGRTFYACNKYPDCKFALWSKPTGEKCPDCESLVVYGKKGTAACSSKECKFTKVLEE